MLDPGSGPIGDEPRLIQLVVRRIDEQRVADPGFRPQLFSQAPGVMADDGIRRLQNIAGGAIVLFQTEHPDRRKILFEFQDVFDLRATPPIDGLIVVPHRHELPGHASQQLEPCVLHAVGVLELIHQQITKAVAVVGQDVGVFQPQFVTAQQQLRKVHCAGLLTCRFVPDIDVAERPVDRPDRVDVAAPPAFVLCGIDERRRLPRREPLFVDAERADDPAHQPHLIVAVENLKALRQPRCLPMDAQQSMGNAVKRPHPQGAQRQAEQRFDAPPHLPRGLVGERHRHDVVGRRARLQQVRDAMHQHARLAAARASQHETVAWGRAYGGALGVIQRGKKAFRIHAQRLREHR